MSKFNIGDEVVVTNNDNGFGMFFDVGAVGTVALAEPLVIVAFHSGTFTEIPERKDVTGLIDMIPENGWGVHPDCIEKVSE